MRRLTKDFFDTASIQGYELVTSSITLNEIRSGPTKTRKKLLSSIRENNVKVWLADVRVKRLANSYLSRGIVPLEFSPDAEHIAAASILGVDVMVSWNLRHIVNVRTKLSVQEINTQLGYKVPAIARPDEMI